MHTLVDFKDGVVQGTFVIETEEPSFSTSEELCDVNQFDDLNLDMAKDQPENTEHKLAAALLKLENIFHVPSAAVDEFLEELQYLLSTASLCSTTKVIHDTLNSYNFQVDESVIKELASVLVIANPVYKSVAKDCPLATSFKRKKYYKDNFKEPIEYILYQKDKRTLQYVPLLKFLQQLVTDGHIFNKVLNSQPMPEGRSKELIYKSYRDGVFFKENSFLSGGQLRVLLNLYVDDFEICNPLGTSRKRHKICAVYWNLAICQQVAIPLCLPYV